MTRADMIERANALSKIRFEDGAFADYEDGEVYVSKAFFTLSEAKLLADWIKNLTEEIE